MILLDPNLFKLMMYLKTQESKSVGIALILAVLILISLFANMIKSSDVSTAVAGVLVAGIGSVLVWGFRSRISKTHGNTEKDTLSPRIIVKESTTNEIIENEERIKNTIKIKTNDYKVYEFNLKRGQKVRGKISSDGTFNVYFLTKSSFRSFKNDMGFNALDGIDDAHYFEPNFSISRKDIIYAVIENSDKTNIVVNVELYV